MILTHDDLINILASADLEYIHELPNLARLPFPLDVVEPTLSFYLVKIVMYRHQNIELTTQLLPMMRYILQ